MQNLCCMKATSEETLIITVAVATLPHHQSIQLNVIDVVPLHSLLVVGRKVVMIPQILIPS